MVLFESSDLQIVVSKVLLIIRRCDHSDHDLVCAPTAFSQPAFKLDHYQVAKSIVMMWLSG